MSPHKQAKRAFSKGEFATARRLYREIADEGDGDAQIFLGWLLMWGDPQNSDIDQARIWLERAAQRGSDVAEHYLGSLNFDTGSMGEAEQWFRRAAQKGNSGAMYRLGKMGLSGQFPTITEKEAVGLLFEAMNKGHLFAKIACGHYQLRHGSLLNRASGLGLLISALASGPLLAAANPYDDRLRT